MGISELRPQPRAGERVLILRAEWLEHILSGAKDLEIRGAYVQEGGAWLGRRFCVLGTRGPRNQDLRGMGGAAPQTPRCERRSSLQVDVGTATTGCRAPS